MKRAVLYVKKNLNKIDIAANSYGVGVKGLADAFAKIASLKNTYTRP